MDVHTLCTVFFKLETFMHEAPCFAFALYLCARQNTHAPRRSTSNERDRPPSAADATPSSPRHTNAILFFTQLTPEEQFFLDNASADIKRQFEAADKAIGEAAVMSMAAAGRAR